MFPTDAQYKVRMVNPDSQAQVATFLGPTFAGPISQVVMFKSATSEEVSIGREERECE